MHSRSSGVGAAAGLLFLHPRLRDGQMKSLDELPSVGVRQHGPLSTTRASKSHLPFLFIGLKNG
jgi:hypothetical protein